MPHLRDADGNTVVDNLTPAEIDRLQREGVPTTTGDDPDGDDPADGDGSGDNPAPDDPDTDPADDPTSAGPDGSSEADDGVPDDDGSRDGEPTDAGGGGAGPDTGPDMDLDGLDDPDTWDDWSDDDGTPGDPDDPDDDGGSPAGPEPTDGNGVGPDDLDDAVDDMMDRSDDRDLSDRAGDAGIDGNEDRWEDRLDRIRTQSDIPEATRERDRRGREGIEKVRGPDGPPHCRTEDLRPWAEGSGFIDDLIERFQEIKEATSPTNSRRGSKVDRSRLTRFRAGDQNARDFYLRSNGQRTKARRSLGVALDISGSMGDPANPDADGSGNGPERIDVAKTAVAGLARAVETIGDTFTASAFRTGHDGAGQNRATAPLITAPDEQFEWGHLDTVTANLGTPMAYGIEKATQRLLQTDQPEKTLFVVCDGSPTHPVALENTEAAEGAQNAEDNVSARVHQARQAGVDVVGIGIGDVSEIGMYQMFREGPNQDPDDAPYVVADTANLPDQLARLYEDTLK